MNIVNGVGEAEFLAAMDRIVPMLSRRFEIAGYTRDDIAQQMYVFALQALPNYRREQGTVGAFLWRHCSNRLANLLRDTVRRNDGPCDICCNGGACGPDGQPCEKYRQWLKLQQKKAALASTAPAELSDSGGSFGVSESAADDVEVTEILRILDARLDAEERRVMLQMRAGLSVPKHKRQPVEEKVLRILEEAGVGAGDIGLA